MRTGVSTEIVQFAGGLDLVSPAMEMRPGTCIDALNFEPDINGGYKRMAGIERYDGRASPSSASYWLAACTISATVNVGDTITGATSGATAVVLQVNGSTELVLTKLTGTFVAENFTVSASVKGSITSVTINSAISASNHANYKSLAANNYRADIQKPAGSGPIRGVHYYNGSLYCFRDNVGATACNMFKATTSGWVQINFGREIQFNAATGQINEGDTITGGTSGATGVVKRALLRTGAWASAGVGTLVFDTVTGVFQNGEALKVGATSKATSTSVDTAIKLNPGGRFDCTNNNFSGTTATFRMYGCDGVNPAFEFDGARLVPIRTGIGSDAPKYITAWKNMLVVAISSSIAVSGVGQPYSWTALTGASELALGDDCTGILPQLGDANSGALAIFTISKTFVLYGNSSADFKLVNQSPDAGAQPYTAQNIGFAYYLDTKGVVQINATRAYGNFQLSTLTRLIQPIIDAKRGLAKASCIVRANNQYRIFFSDGTGIILYMVPVQPDAGGGVAADALGGCMYFDYGSSRYMNVVTSIVDTSGIERIFAAGSDGYVYELNRGTSIDGSNIQAHLMLAFNSSRSPRNRKHYRRTVLQVTCTNTANVRVGYELDYGSINVDPGIRQASTFVGGGSYWDVMTWDQFTWDAPYVSEYTIDTCGNGKNISMLIYADNAIDESYTIHSGIFNYTVGRLER